MQTGTDAADKKSKHKQRGGSGGLEVFVVWRFQVRLNTAHSTPRCQVLLTSDRKSQEGGLGCTNDWHRWRRQRTKVRMEAHDSVLMPGSPLGLLPSGTRSRGSTRVIWFRDGSHKEGDRIVAWYKLERELGLRSGFTESYSSRSP